MVKPHNSSGPNLSKRMSALACQKSMNAKPKYSLITATFNSINTIAGLAESIIKQKDASFEWIVIDGGSRDGTLEYLKSLKTDFLNLISEADNGIYDALNKGIKISRGDYLLFLGSDDRLVSENTIRSITRKTDSLGRQPKVLLGDVMIETNRMVPFKSSIGFKTLIINSAHHQGTLYARVLFDEFKYDKSIPVVADYELNLMIYLQKIDFIHLNMTISVCGGYGISKTVSEKLCYRDMNKIRGKHINIFFSYFYYFLGIANIYRRKFLS